VAQVFTDRIPFLSPIVVKDMDFGIEKNMKNMFLYFCKTCLKCRIKTCLTSVVLFAV